MRKISKNIEVTVKEQYADYNFNGKFRAKKIDFGEEM